MKRYLWIAALAAGCGGGDEAAAPAEGEKPAEGAKPEGEAAKPAEGEAAKPAEAPAEPFAKLDAIKGTVKVTRGGAAAGSEVGAVLEMGDVVETGKDGKARIVLRDKTILALGSDSKMTLAKLETDDKGRRGSFMLAAGKFWAQVAAWTGTGESYVEFETPNAVAGVRGTTLWGDVKVDAICALEGEIEVKAKKAKPTAKPAKLTAGNCAAKLSKGKTAPLKPKPKQVEKYLEAVIIK